MDAVVERASGSIGEVEGLAVRIDDVVTSTGKVIEDAQGVVQSGSRTTSAAEETIRAAEPSVRQLAEITETISRLQPLLGKLAEIDPAASDELVGMLRSLPGLVERIDERVVPAVGSLEGLVPVVETLHDNVDQLQHVVNDVGTLLSGLPGASRLLKRGGKEVRSADNKTAITPPE